MSIDAIGKFEIVCKRWRWQGRSRHRKSHQLGCTQMLSRSTDDEQRMKDKREGVQSIVDTAEQDDHHFRIILYDHCPCARIKLICFHHEETHKTSVDRWVLGTLDRCTASICSDADPRARRWECLSRETREEIRRTWTSSLTMQSSPCWEGKTIGWLVGWLAGDPWGECFSVIGSRRLFMGQKRGK